MEPLTALEALSLQPEPIAAVEVTNVEVTAFDVVPPVATAEAEVSPIEVTAIEVVPPVQSRSDPRFERGLNVNVRSAGLLTSTPWIRSLGKLPMEVSTQGWRFPTPPELKPQKASVDESGTEPAPAREVKIAEEAKAGPRASRTRPLAPASTLQIKDRLLYLLQPPLEDIFAGRQISLPFKPYPYQLQGIAFLMPRHNALIADEMGLGKTMQTIVAMRLLFHGGLLGNALIVCPKPLVINWTREMRTWAPDLPFEIIGGDTASRRAGWYVSNCPLKLVNYELLTRDAELLADERVHFDLVVLDEAQRIKNKESKTAQVVCSLRRDRSWAMSGTPVENRSEDLVNIFAFVDPERIPAETPAKQLRALTSDCIIRRTKEDVATDMPPRVMRDAVLELTPAQREAYDLAEKDGVIHLNGLGDTITVQHVFELVMRLKQICNFDPRTGQSAKLEQLVADMSEVAACGRKAIIFSQWVDPLERIARELQVYEPLQYHGKIPHVERQPILDKFKSDPSKHVILMSYGTGSVGLNLQFTNYVFLFDRWWNPAVEDQAINRAHRLGQTSTVFVTRFISLNTIEQRIAEVLEKKRALFAELIEQNDMPVMGLNEEDIFGLFDIQSRPKKAAA